MRSGGPVALLFALALLGACGGSKPPPKTADTDAAFEAAIAAEKEQDAKRDAPAASRPSASSKGAVAAAPFSWEQIRAATKNGRTYRYRVEVPGKPAKERVLTFTKVDESGAEIFAGGDAPRRMGWQALQKDAEFPKDKLTVHEESVKLPGGKFDCVVYEVRGDAGETWTYFFAKSLPGAPVLFYTEQDGRRVKTTTLLQHIPGKDS
ncbi:MAG TPA: hypothetical protein VLT33_40090 [Labilithrix sp.]|nr:hypothetical protein [Labilithrix sp.]